MNLLINEQLNLLYVWFRVCISVFLKFLIDIKYYTELYLCCTYCHTVQGMCLTIFIQHLLLFCAQCYNYKLMSGSLYYFSGQELLPIMLYTLTTVITKLSISRYQQFAEYIRWLAKGYLHYKMSSPDKYRQLKYGNVLSVEIKECQYFMQLISPYTALRIWKKPNVLKLLKSVICLIHERYCQKALESHDQTESEHILFTIESVVLM